MSGEVNYQGSEVLLARIIKQTRWWEIVYVCVRAHPHNCGYDLFRGRGVQWWCWGEGEVPPTNREGGRGELVDVSTEVAASGYGGMKEGSLSYCNPHTLTYI